MPSDPDSRELLIGASVMTLFALVLVLFRNLLH